MSDKVLLVDAQLLQTAAWERGMGAYCLALLKDYATRNDALPITFICNKNLELTDAKRHTFKKYFPQSDIVMLDLPTLDGNVARGKHKATTRLDEYIRINHKGQSVHFLILGLFMFHYCASFPTQVAAKLLIFYDLIPLIRWRDFSALFSANLYFSHFSGIFEADVIYAISETTKRQLENELSIAPGKIVNLNGATIERESRELVKKPDLPKPYILMISADYPHKNNENAVKAFAQFNREFGDDFTLVVTSTFSDDSQELLRTYTENIVFTGNITEQVLDYYYRGSAAIMLVSYIEGLGLPLLEGVMYDKPVICSTIDVFEELSKKAFYFANPDSAESITKALVDGVAKLNWADKQAEYKRIESTYTWRASAERLADSLQHLPHQQPAKKPKKGAYNFVLPHPATSSGNLGAVVQSLVWGLSTKADIHYWVSEDVYVDSSQKAYFMDRMAWVGNVKHLSPAGLRSRKNVYFIDETGASVEVVRRAVAVPGICFVMPKSAGLLSELVHAGYIGEADKKSLRAKHKVEAMSALLEQAGNVVHRADFLDTQRNNQSIIEDIITKI
ncbi:MAG TPA: glycosyltransferase [Verrucomicrobiae bacterium]|nr:glycosyltransferase [Verrucomicrobiae bacterium]